jgi:Kdo2-lipid IVA lauroyltransferase/acyltransferase
MIFIRLLSHLPFSLLYRLSDFLFFVSYRLVRYRRKLVSKNLKRSFPTKTKDELKTIEKEFYRNLCDYAVETIKLLTLTAGELKKRVIFINADDMLQHKGNNQSVILLASHQFNWEWTVAAGNLWLPFPVDFVYQPVKNKLFDSLLLQCRSRFGAFPIKRNDVAREIIKRKQLLRAIAIVADQYPGQKKDKRVFTTFLNQKTAFFFGTNQLAVMTQYPVFFSSIKKLKRGFYEVSLIPIASPPYERNNIAVIENYAKATEALIGEYPSGWLWSHNRWKKRHALLKQASAKYLRV